MGDIVSVSYELFCSNRLSIWKLGKNRKKIQKKACILGGSMAYICKFTLYHA